MSPLTPQSKYNYSASFPLFLSCVCELSNSFKGHWCMLYFGMQWNIWYFQCIDLCQVICDSYDTFWHILISVVWFCCFTKRSKAGVSWLASASFLSLQRCVMRPSPRCQQNRRSSLRLKWECWTEDGGSTLYSRKNPLKASTNTCLPSSLTCVTG